MIYFNIASVVSYAIIDSLAIKGSIESNADSISIAISCSGLFSNAASAMVFIASAIARCVDLRFDPCQ